MSILLSPSQALSHLRAHRSFRLLSCAVRNWTCSGWNHVLEDRVGSSGIFGVDFDRDQYAHRPDLFSFVARYDFGRRRADFVSAAASLSLVAIAAAVMAPRMSGENVRRPFIV